MQTPLSPSQTKRGPLTSNKVLRPLLACVALAMPVWAAAGYYQWEMVELPASSGAVCGNGSPYRFFVNRVPETTKTIVIFEGGGACYDKAACQYKSGFLGAINPNGVPKDYMTTVVPSLPNTVGTKIGVFNSALLGNISPFSSRNNPSKVKTQSWNIVYAPYCTGDVYTGNRAAVYAEPDGSLPIVYQHRGNINSEAMVDWVAANMPKPEQLFVTGFSAGGIGATANYAYVRDKLQPGKSAMMADSGPLFNVPAGSTPETAPSTALHQTVRKAWGIDEPDGMVQRLLTRYPAYANLDTRNLGILNEAIAKVFPQDRIGFTLTQSDKLFASFAYDNFFPEIRLGKTIQDRDAMRVVKWRQEVASWVDMLSQTGSNTGYYLPYGREAVLKSHTTTMLTFNATDIPEAGTKSVTDFVDNLLDGSGPVMRIVESPNERKQTIGGIIAIWIQNWIFGSLGV